MTLKKTHLRTLVIAAFALAPTLSPGAMVVTPENYVQAEVDPCKKVAGRQATN